MHRHHQPQGFTLIELLVVIAVIAVLAAILFPVFAQAREKARQSTCNNNQRQILTALMMYAQDHDETFPSYTTVWSDINISPGVLRCPTAGKSRLNAYVFDGGLSKKTLSVVTDPTSAFMTADGYSATNVALDLTCLTPIHNNRVIASYVDGHVSAVDPSKLAIFVAPAIALTVINPSFEYPAETDGNWTSDMSASDWTETGGSIGISNCSNTNYTNTSALSGVDRKLPQPFDGYQLCYFNAAGTVSQVLAERATPGQTYTLTVAFGCGLNAVVPMNGTTPQYNVALLFNGVSKSTTTYPSPQPSPGQVTNITATYTAVEADREAQITVQLSATAGSGNPFKQANFDNVRVTKTQN